MGRDNYFNHRQTSLPTPVRDDLSKVLLNLKSFKSRTPW
ncbi:hypothetical protein IFVP203_C180013 [Vibrio parahaemolyticus]